MAGPEKHQGHGMKCKPNQVSKKRAVPLEVSTSTHPQAVRPQYGTMIAIRVRHVQASHTEITTGLAACSLHMQSEASPR